MNGTTAGLRRWAAIGLLAVLCLGSGLHFLHHLADPGCDPYGKHGSLPCTACSVLHGAAIAPQAEISAPQAPCAIARLVVAEAREPEARQRVSGTPRAPPAA